MRLQSCFKEGGGNNMSKENVLGWLGAVLILLGYYINANEFRESWLVWILGNTMIGFYCLNKKAYPTAVMSFILVFLNIYGYISWSR